MRTLMLAGLAALTLTACGTSAAVREATTAPTIAPAARPSAPARVATALHLRKAPPAMRWGDDNPEWTAAALDALNEEGITLLSTVPSDVLQFCPGYATASRESRAAFWAGLLSSVAKHESGHRAGAKGGGGRYLGLMQISAPTARANGCRGSLLRGEDNLRCAVRIMARHVVRDNAIAGGKRGLARDWMPLRSSAKRSDIAGWTRKQSYCR